MTPEEMDSLATRIAGLLVARGWVAPTVRPEPPGRPSASALPVWAGAAQALSDVAPAPGQKTGSGPLRPAYDALTAAVRGAAAGRSPSPMPGGAGAPVADKSGGAEEIKVGVSGRHLHISESDIEHLFGSGQDLTPEQPIKQPGQYAARERVRVVGPKGAIDNVRIVGPARGKTQVELAGSDYRRLGIDAPVRVSGNTEGSAPVRLEGPAGSLDLTEGAIVTARHLHLAPDSAKRLGLSDGDTVTIAAGRGDQRVVLPDVLARAGEKHATELHINSDEAQAFGALPGDTVSILSSPRREPEPQRVGARRLITERDVGRLAADGEVVGDSGPYLLTPAAKDRAKALGVWCDTSE